MAAGRSIWSCTPVSSGFREAVEFLADAPPTPRTSRPPHPSAAALRLPDPVERPTGRPCGTSSPALRGLDPALLEQCRRAGTLYADSPPQRRLHLPRPLTAPPPVPNSSAPRPLPDGSTFKGLAAGSRRDRGGFWLTTGSAPPAAVLLTESAVDALSAVLLPAPDLPPDCLVASTAGTARRLPRWLHAFQHLPLLCGYDADPAGDQAARALRRQHPRLHRLRPHGAKDWNDLLQLLAPC